MKGKPFYYQDNRALHERKNERGRAVGDIPPEY